MSDLIVWKQTKVLDLLYFKIARSFCGQIACPHITTFRLGYGFVDVAGATPQLQAIPGDLDELPGVFYVGTPETAASDNRALFDCNVPAGAIATPTQCTLIGLYDQDDDLLAVGQRIPEWLTPDESNTYRPYFDFPQGDN